jgi:hypothetical protein
MGDASKDIAGIKLELATLTAQVRAIPEELETFREILMRKSPKALEVSEMRGGEMMVSREELRALETGLHEAVAQLKQTINENYHNNELFAIALGYYVKSGRTKDQYNQLRAWAKEGEGLAGRVRRLLDAHEELRAQVNAIPEVPDITELQEEVASLRQEVADLKRERVSVPDDGPSGALQDTLLQAMRQISALEHKVRNNKDFMDALESKITALQLKTAPQMVVQTIPERQEDDSTALREQVSRLMAVVATLQLQLPTETQPTPADPTIYVAPNRLERLYRDIYGYSAEELETIERTINEIAKIENYLSEQQVEANEAREQLAAEGGIDHDLYVIALAQRSRGNFIELLYREVFGMERKTMTDLLENDVPKALNYVKEVRDHYETLKGDITDVEQVDEWVIELMKDTYAHLDEKSAEDSTAEVPRNYRLAWDFQKEHEAHKSHGGLQKALFRLSTMLFGKGVCDQLSYEQDGRNLCMTYAQLYRQGRLEDMDAEALKAGYRKSAFTQEIARLSWADASLNGLTGNFFGLMGRVSSGKSPEEALNLVPPK